MEQYISENASSIWDPHMHTCGEIQCRIITIPGFLFFFSWNTLQNACTSPNEIKLIWEGTWLLFCYLDWLSSQSFLIWRCIILLFISNLFIICSPAAFQTQQPISPAPGSKRQEEPSAITDIQAFQSGRNAAHSPDWHISITLWSAGWQPLKHQWYPDLTQALEDP